MRKYGAHGNRLVTLLLAVTMLITTCFPTALAADIWDEFVLSVLWTDEIGQLNAAQAYPIQDSADRAYWVQVDASALGRKVTVDAYLPDPSYRFYLEDEWGGQTATFTWQPEMDALSTGYEYAHQVFYTVDGTPADRPILLYVSTSGMPRQEEEERFEPYPVQVRVNYVTEDGATLDTQYAECWAGETTPVWASSMYVEGYELIGSERADVSVDRDGNAEPREVTFVYRQVATPTPVPTDVPTPTPVAEVSVPVVYYHVNGTQLDFQEAILPPGSHVIRANSAKVANLTVVGSDWVDIVIYPDGSASMDSVVFYYEDPAPAEAWVAVYYYHEDGRLLDMQEISLTEGNHTIRPESTKVDGYELTGESAADVTVHADGSASPAYVQFLYKDVYVAPAEAWVAVYYYHEDGRLLDMQEVQLTEGRHTIRPESTKVDGYELTGESAAEVTVHADGSASPAYVQFLYKDRYVAPAEAQITVNYYHVDRGLLDSKTITLTEGVHLVKAESSKVGEYLPRGNTSVEVTVHADGSASPAAVDFYYEDADVAPVTAELTVVYRMDDVHVIRESRILTAGSHRILPDPSKIGSYVLDGEQSAEVYVDENGFISPEPTVFFDILPAAVTITVHYQDDRGRDVAPSQTMTFDRDGDYIIRANPEGLSSEYELAPGLHSEVQVTVSGGAASQEDVYFYYQLKQTQPTAAVVTVRYFDTYGKEIAQAQNITLNPGRHQLTPDTAIVPAGYELVSDAAITVEVYDNGTFSPQEVGFYYRQAVAEEPTVTITVYYRDDRGNDLAQPQTRALTNGTHIIRAEPENLPAGYEIFANTADAVEVVVRNGAPSRNQVVFYYQKTSSEPSVFTLPVYYYDTMGNPVATTQYVQIGAGTYAIQANPADLPAGYELMMESVMTVVVRQDGTTDPEEIAFYYRAPEKKASVIVSYVDEDDRAIIAPFTVELAAGYHTIKPDANRVPGGYDPDSARPVQVYVSREGEANPDHVTLVFEKLVVETPIPVGENVYRYATVNDKSVAFRTEPTTSGGNKTVIRRLNKNEKAYVLKEVRNDKNEVWAQVVINGQDGYMMSKFLDVMTQAESDAYASGSTPAPTFTPVPTVTAVPTFTPVPTATPTADPTVPPLVEEIRPDPTQTATEVPTATPTVTPTPYAGYALTTRVTALRTGISASDMTIMQTLQAGELVDVVNQMADPVTGEMWAIVSTLNKQAGFVQSSALRPITDKEAEPYLQYWEEMNREHEATEPPTPTPEPMQLQGYGIVLGDDVPFRQMQSEFSRIIDNLAAGTVVYITGQTAGDGQYWHSVNYEGRWGYIRTDLVRMMTIAEEEAYLESQKETPTPATTNLPFDETGLSSYGYVDGSSVNWREGPSTGAKRIGELKRFAFCLVLGTEHVNGVTWYRVSYGDKTGYVHGDFFRQMTIVELEEFLGSDEYLQGIANNSASGTSGKDDAGYTGTDGIVSAEDQWVNRYPDVYASFEPFNPIATVAPIPTGTPTLEPLPGWNTTATATPSPSPSPTPTFNPLPEITYPIADEGEGGSALIWIVVAGLLLMAIGGVFVMVRHQQNKRRIALRAAQRRAQAARQQQQQRPYARSAQGQPRTGTYASPKRPNPANDFDSQYTGYTGEGSNGGAYFRPLEESFTPEDPHDFVPKVKEEPQQQTGRVGRRTAYRQAQRAKEDDSFNL